MKTVKEKLYCGDSFTFGDEYARRGSSFECMRKGYGSALYRNSDSSSFREKYTYVGRRTISPEEDRRYGSIEMYINFLNDNFDRAKETSRNLKLGDVFTQLAIMWRNQYKNDGGEEEKRSDDKDNNNNDDNITIEQEEEKKEEREEKREEREEKRSIRDIRNVRDFRERDRDREYRDTDDEREEEREEKRSIRDFRERDRDRDRDREYRDIDDEREEEREEKRGIRDIRNVRDFRERDRDREYRDTDDEREEEREEKREEEREEKREERGIREEEKYDDNSFSKLLSNIDEYEKSSLEEITKLEKLLSKKEDLFDQLQVYGDIKKKRVLTIKERKEAGNIIEQLTDPEFFNDIAKRKFSIMKDKIKNREEKQILKRKIKDEYNQDIERIRQILI